MRPQLLIGTVFTVVFSSLCLAATPTPPDLGIGGSLHGVRMLPDDSLWNRDISKDPVDPNSAALLASIGVGKPLHPDFGTTYEGHPNGIPYVVVDSKTPKIDVKWTDYPDESDKGPYPIPPNAPIEGGPKSDGDRHVLVLDRDTFKLYELWRAFPSDDGKAWKASNGAIWDLKTGAPRPAGWTSADAAGLPIFPGLVRYDEVVEQKAVRHAFRFTIQHSRRAYVPPATHFASHSSSPNLPPMGMRVRLRADFDTSNLPPQAKVIAETLKTYGMILADNGSDWYLSGAPNDKWDDDDLGALRHIHGKDFEVIAMPKPTTK
jgi:hypothetical protein